MGTKRVGLARVEALIENLKREIALGGAGLTGVNSLALSTEAITAAGAASVSVPVSLITSDGDTMAVTLADGSTVGQLKYFVSMHATNAASVTPATTAGAWTSFTLTNIGESVTCIWTASGWALLSRSSSGAEAVNSIAAAPLVSA